jgi:nitrogenase-associated protein
MVAVIFYEKPGCVNNTKQKALLQAAGHEVEAHSLLLEPWTKAKLRLFFGNLPVAQWFNPSAPSIKSGKVMPETLDAETALELMLKDPLLIRRPLMQVGDRYYTGFDSQEIDTWIGLTPVEEEDRTRSAALMAQDLQACPRDHAH